MFQMVAAEAIVQTASKRERCSAIISSGIPILKKLYDSPNDNIKARALVVCLFFRALGICLKSS